MLYLSGLHFLRNCLLCEAPGGSGAAPLSGDVWGRERAIAGGRYGTPAEADVPGRASPLAGLAAPSAGGAPYTRATRESPGASGEGSAGDGSADWGRVVDKAVVVPRSGPPGVEGGAMPLPHTPLYECPEGHSKCPFPS